MRRPCEWRRLASAFNLAFIAIPAWASNQWGRKPVLIAGYVGFTILSYPLYVLLSSGRMGAMVAAAFGFVALATCFMGPAMTVAMEHFPTDVLQRFRLRLQCRGRASGSTTPLAAGWLIHATGLRKRFQLLPYRGVGHPARDLSQTTRNFQAQG